MRKAHEYNAMAAQLDSEVGSVFPELDDGEVLDTHRNAPRPDPACLYGLVGDVARAGSDNTEANPYAVAMAFMTYLSAAIGRGPFLHIGDDWHRTRLFTLHVGRSGIGRKGTATKLVKRIANAVEAIDEHLAPQIHTGGLSSREGLALLIHDGFKDGKNEVPPINDKRLWVIESEFANILHQSKRDGNTLSPALRDCWDGESIKPATKTNRVWASHPHVSMTGNVTPSELLELMKARELSNGFANRFVIFWAERSKSLPFPKPTPKNVVEALAQRVVEVLQFAGADRHVDRDVIEVRLAAGDEGAARLYAKLYRGELDDRSGGERIAGLTDRRTAMLQRMAMLFALTDLSTEISERHLRAALAWVRYWTDSVKFIFQSAQEEVETAAVASVSNKIVQWLREHGQATRTELTRDCFRGHESRERLDKAIDELLTTTPPTIVVNEVERSAGTPGTRTKVYTLAAKCANSANSVQNQVLSPSLPTANSCEPLRNLGVHHHVDPSNAEQFATLRTVRAPENAVQTLDLQHSSHTSQSSHAVSVNQGADAEDSEVF